jgi:hypothetical protein
MLRTRLVVLVLAAAAALAACGGKKATEAKQNSPAATPPAATPPAATPPAATPPAAAGELKLPLAERKPGLKWTKTDDMTSQMQIGPADKQITVDGSRHYVDQLEIVEVDAAGIVTKVKAAYPERKDTEQMGDKTREKPSSLVGKSYVAWFANGKLEATHEDGSAVSPEELDELAKDLDEVGKPRVMDQIVAGRAWKVGETYTFTADELARLNAAKGPSAPTGTAMALTLREVTGDRAIFEMKSTMQVETKAALKMEMSGAVAIDVKTGHPITLELSGPIAGTVSGQPVTGTMTGKVAYQFTAP